MTVLATGRGTALRLVLGCVIVIAAWWLVRPALSGVGLGAVARTVTSVDATHLGLLVGIWAMSAALHAVIVSLALPGLGTRRAVTLSLAGSALINTVPMGGTVATIVTWRMATRWGQPNSTFVAYSAVVRMLAVVMKLFLPVVAVGCLVAASTPVPAVLRWVAAGCGLALAATAAALLWLCRRGHATAPLRRTRSLPHFLRRSGELLAGSGEQFLLILRDRWAVLSATGLACSAAQILLLGVCLDGVGLSVPIAALVAAAAVERLGSVITLTPGGAGVAEAGTIAWLVATGLDPTSCVAGVVLYRAVLIAMELPVGGALLLGWAITRGGNARLTRRTLGLVCQQCGFGDRGFGDRGFGDRGFGDRGLGDRGFGDCGCALAPLLVIPRAGPLAAPSPPFAE